MTDTTLDVVDGVYDLDTDWQGMIQESVAGLTAATFPVKPPADWFTDPSFDRLTPLTIDNSGRVYGHIAAWHTSHIGMAGGVKPPKSKSNYAFYRTGVVETEDGGYVDVGQITLAGGHAPLNVSVAKAVAHYDDTKSALMDVAAGEDRHGIWVAGALRPDVTDEQIRALRASSVSGDWRPINGRLELVAVCAVNCPGFPIPRARVAGGAPIALVAAGVEPLIERVIELRADQDIEAGIRAGLETFRERLTSLETVVLASITETGPLATEEAEQLRRRVRPDRVADIETRKAELRNRVHQSNAEDGELAEVIPLAPDEATPDAVVDSAAAEVATLAASLRAKVHG